MDPTGPSADPVDTPPGASAPTEGGRPALHADPPDDPVETPGLREDACCRSEPPCLLCPLRSENAERSLRELRDEGLYANLERLGFRARPR